MISLYVWNIFIIFLYMSTLYLIAQKIKDNSIVDIGWGFGFVIISVTSLIVSENMTARALLVGLLVALWGIRLGTYLWIRASGKPEDFRYANFRKQWGEKVKIIAFFRVFMLQGTIMLLISFPIVKVMAHNTTENLDIFAVVGLIIWLIGYFFQVVGDAQLASFKKKRASKEQVLTTGLWKYTRHPNYFGEACMWWGIAIVVLPVPHGFWGILSALFMNTLLLKVSGVPFLDRRYASNASYQQYKRTTNRFIPWFPKRNA